MSIIRYLCCDAIAAACFLRKIAHFMSTRKKSVKPLRTSLKPLRTFFS